MGSAERRQKIIELLYVHKRIEMTKLAARFGVTYRTIQRDIYELSRNYRVVIKSGKNGGVSLLTEPQESKPPITEENLRVLTKLRDAANKEVCNLTQVEMNYLMDTITWIRSDYRLLKESEKRR